MQPILNPYLEGFYESDHRYYILHGGRSSGKTFHTAGFCVYLAAKYKVKFLCVRQFQNRIADSVKSTIERCIDLVEMRKEFHITENAIRHKKTGSEFQFLGINRNLEDIKGVFGVNILWIEEAESITAEQMKIIIPTIREEGSKIFIVFNPRLKTDYSWKNFIINPPKRSIVRQINYDENPYLSNTMLQEIEDYKDKDDFDHIYLGEPMDTDDNSIIKRSHLLAAVDAHKKLGLELLGSNTIGFDVADDGGDGCALVQSFGNCLVWADEWQAKEDELLKSCTRAWQEARNRNADIVYDAIGIGAFTGSKLDSINKYSNLNSNFVKYKKYFSGGAVLHPDKCYLDTKIKNKHFFSNRKAQSWWSFSDRVRNTYNAVTTGEKFELDEMIFIDGSLPHLNKLIDELSTPTKDFDNNGRVKVESKKDLKKRGVDSPNCFVSGTMVMTNNGNVPIESLKIGDLVLTPMGYSEIVFIHKNNANTISNIGLTGTPEHKVFTWNKGWVSLQMLSSCDIIEDYKTGYTKWQLMNLLYTKARCSQFSTQVNTIVQEGIEVRMLEMKDFYTEGFGLNIMAKYLTTITSITSMVTGVIIISKIWSALKESIINVCTCLKDLKTKIIENKTMKFLTKQESKHLNGMVRQKELSGIENKRQNHSIKSLLNYLFAKYVEIYFYQNVLENQKHVLKNALQKEQMNQLSLNLNTNQTVGTVGKNLSIKNYQEEIKIQDVQDYAQLESVKTVYNITLKEHNVYYANGILVKNCADAAIMCMDKTQSQANHVAISHFWKK